MVVGVLVGCSITLKALLLLALLFLAAMSPSWTQLWNSSLAILPETVNDGAYLAIVLDCRRSLHGNIFHVIINIIWGWNPFLAPSSDALFPLDRKVISFIFKNFLDAARASLCSSLKNLSLPSPGVDEWSLWSAGSCWRKRRLRLQIEIERIWLQRNSNGSLVKRWYPHRLG